MICLEIVLANYLFILLLHHADCNLMGYLMSRAFCLLNFDYSKESYYYSNKFHYLEYFLEVEASILAKKPNKIHKGVAFRDFFFEKEVVWFPERVRKFKICSKAF